MKCLLALVLLLGLAGCAKDPDDTAFFNRGWMKPEAGANQRMYSRSVDPGDR